MKHHPNSLSEVEAALREAARRLEAAGWSVEEIADTPPLREAADLQVRLWLGDGFAGLLAAAEREGDPGALHLLGAFRATAEAFGPDTIPAALTRRATLARAWSLFLDRVPVLLVPVSAELPFPDDLDREGEAGVRRVFEANLLQVALPVIGVPALTVTLGSQAAPPVGVQIVSARFREDLCLLAGEAIEAAGPVPAPVDPA